MSYDARRLLSGSESGRSRPTAVTQDPEEAATKRPVANLGRLRDTSR
jgi:hypothetical protein